MFDVMTTSYPRYSMHYGTKEDCETFLKQRERDGMNNSRIEIVERVDQ